jgi:hypothetical protein
MKLPLLLALVATALVPLASACGGSAPLPGAKTANDVQAACLAQTFAGKNKCDPKTANRPFVIEWDATDMSSFEARAANDVVFVRYDGCDLQIVDACTNDSVRGAFGSYKPVEWTSGSVESIDIDNAGDLYAKLPLGISLLGGRVDGGEKFHMEYFVSGTRSATRESIHRGDLAGVDACNWATHFVYAYNLGAFALGAQASFKGKVVWGAGAGGDRASDSKVEKSGGVLGSCRGDSAKDVSTCRVPIRLTLREIAEGDNPSAASSRPADVANAATDANATSAAATLEARTAREHDAQEHINAARTKANARDGKGCLAELNIHDTLDPRPEGLSTSSGSAYAIMRGQCLMLSGECTLGKTVYRQALEKSAGEQLGPEQLDKAADGLASLNCQGGTMTPRDQLLKALQDLRRGAFLEKTTTDACSTAFDAVKHLMATVQPKDDDDTQVKDAHIALRQNGPQCFAKAGDCDAAFTAWKTARLLDPKLSQRARDQDEKQLRHGFETSVQRCRAK